MLGLAGFDAPRILCYGDSLTAGLAGNFVKTYAPYASRLSQLCMCPHTNLVPAGTATKSPKLKAFDLLFRICTVVCLDLTCFYPPSVNCPVDHVGLCGKTTQDMVK